MLSADSSNRQLSAQFVTFAEASRKEAKIELKFRFHGTFKKTFQREGEEDDRRHRVAIAVAVVVFVVVAAVTWVDHCKFLFYELKSIAKLSLVSLARLGLAWHG